VQGFYKYNSEYSDSVQVFLSKEKFPGFFGWIIPHNEEIAEVGVGVALPNNVGRAWQHMLAIAGVNKEECKPRGAAIPLRVRGRTGISKGKYKVCLVGDAAGQTKATTGGGVIFGSNCARYAGMYSEDPSRYELEWRARFGLDLFIHKNVQAYLQSMSDRQIRELGAKARGMDAGKYLSQHGHMDKPTRMLKPEIFPYILKGFSIN
jgi:flavin-dependent dehydrogenase